MNLIFELYLPVYIGLLRYKKKASVINISVLCDAAFHIFFHV